MAVEWFQPLRLQPDRLAQPNWPVKDHVILVGHGRVGSIVAQALRERNRHVIVIEDNSEIVTRLRTDGVHAILGNAEVPGILESAHVADARWLICAIPNVFEAGEAISHARSINPSIEVLGRAHSDAEIQHLQRHGAQVVIMGEQEIARRMIDHATKSQ